MKFTRSILFLCLFGLAFRVSAQDFTVYFGYDSSVVSSSGILQIVALAKKLKPVQGTWHLEGRSSSAGNTDYNEQLSQRRVEAVKKILLSLNLQKQQIQTKAAGETASRQDIDDPSDRMVLMSFEPDHSQTPIMASPVNPPVVLVSVVDAVTRKPIEGTVFHLGRNTAFTTLGYFVSIGENDSANMRFSATGYQDSTVTLPYTPNLQTVELLPEGVLQKLVFQNIYFYPNTPEIVPESYRALEQLLKQLQARQGVHIQIRGHVNWPEPNPITPDTQRELQKLSEQRAEAVMGWLIKKGIPAQNLSAEGLGYSLMLFPKAVTQGEQAQNRRVEILLLK